MSGPERIEDEFDERDGEGSPPLTSRAVVPPAGHAEHGNAVFWSWKRRSTCGKHQGSRVRPHRASCVTGASIRPDCVVMLAHGADSTPGVVLPVLAEQAAPVQRGPTYVEYRLCEGHTR
jgi:hypothetical protein